MPRVNRKQQEINRELFAQAYISTLDITAAYRQVYPDAKTSTAQVNGYRLFKHPKTQELIRKHFNKIKNRFELNEKAIIEKLKNIIEIDPTAIFNNKFEVKNLSEIPLEVRKLIKNIKVSNNGIQVELPDKLEALTKIGQHIGMFGTNKSGDDNRYLVRIYVVPPINYNITLPDTKQVAKQLIDSRINKHNNNGNSNSKKIRELEQ